MYLKSMQTFSQKRKTKSSTMVGNNSEYNKHEEQKKRTHSFS